ncbi:MAG: hypothetical protein ACUVXG_07205 [Anaerolineae bacterium]
MKHKWVWRSLLAVMLLLALTVPVLADDGGNGTVRFGEDLVVRSGDRLRGDAVVFGANALVESGGLIAGDLAVMGGNATIEGEVLGNIVVFGGNVDLKDGSQVAGNVVSFGGSIQQAAGARVQGQVFSSLRWESLWKGWLFRRQPVPEVPGLPGQPLAWWNAALAGLLGLVRSVVGALIMSLLMAGLAALALLFLSEQTKRVAGCLQRAWPTSLGVGLLALVAVVGVAAVLIVTICLAPVGLLLLLAGAVAWVFGLIAIGAIVGDKLFQNLKVGETAPLVRAMVGTGLIVLLSHTPCIGWLLGLAAGVLGLGAVILTQFGTRPYPPEPTAAAPETIPLEPPTEPQQES